MSTRTIAYLKGQQTKPPDNTDEIGLQEKVTYAQFKINLSNAGIPPVSIPDYEGKKKYIYERYFGKALDNSPDNPRHLKAINPTTNRDEK